MAYVYRHIRLDTNIPFYIGIGSDTNGKYSRAHTKATRSKHWHNIIKKSGYEIEIIIDDISWQQAQEKEIEFISLYGRKDKGGLLCNLTDGGGGTTGTLVSLETREKQRLKKLGKPNGRKGIPRPPHVIEAVIRATKGKPSWNKGISQSKETVEKWRKSMQGKFRYGKDHHMYGKKMPDHIKEKFRELNKTRIPWNKGKKYKSSSPNSQASKRIKVFQYNEKGILLNTFISMCEAEEKTGISKGTIGCSCRSDYIKGGGFFWRKENDLRPFRQKPKRRDFGLPKNRN